MIESIEVSLDEGCRERSEPDVILDFGSRGVVFIEAKLRSDNDATPADYANWPKYFKDTTPFKSTEAVRQSGHYQLARNWRLAWALAGGRSMALVNLGQDILFTRKENRRRLDQFKSGLATSETSQFVEATWKEIIGPAAEHPNWLRTYFDERRVMSDFRGFVRTATQSRAIRGGTLCQSLS